MFHFNGTDSLWDENVKIKQSRKNSLLHFQSHSHKEVRKFLKMNVLREIQFAIVTTKRTIKNVYGDKELDEGTLLKIQNMEDSGEFTFIVESNEERQMFETPRTYSGLDIDGIIFISPDVFKFALAIRSTKERMKFCKCEEKKKFILGLEVGEPVKIPKGSFSHNDYSYLRGFVKYIGLIKEIGPGHFFIITLMVIFISLSLAQTSPYVQRINYFFF